MIGSAVTRNGLLLGAFAVLTTAIIAATQLSTKDRIAEQIRQAREKALLEIVPRDRHDNQMLDAQFDVDDQELLHLAGLRSGFIASLNGDMEAVILPVIAPDGYSGKIELLVGINIDGSVAGVRVVQHAETPGLGDKIDLKKSDWILSFNGRSLTDPEPERWAVKKDNGEFDQFTGATITPRAVTTAVYNALLYFREHLQHIEQNPVVSPTSGSNQNGQ